MSNHSIHHVTAVTAKVGDNLSFYTQTLGLRLVKKSVNQDDVSAYHLFYADRAGSPGTDMTFFDWPSAGGHVPGAGDISLTTFRVPGASLDWWEARLEEAATGPLREPDEFGIDRILFTDPEGQRLELIDDTGMAGGGVAWDASVPAENAIRGILGVDLVSLRPELTRGVVTQLLGFRPAGDSDVAFESAGETSYGRIRIYEPDGRKRARLGAGGTHHVAFRVADDEELLAMQKEIEAVGLQTSGLVDRFYFHSLYFREPGGVLFELATDGPGFGADESADTLGSRLALPPFLELQRDSIEANLKPLPVLH
jgi:glyoxalase family protein